MAAPPEGNDPEWSPTNTQGATTTITTTDFSPPSEFRRVTRQYKRRKNGTTATEITRGQLFEFSGSGEVRPTNPEETLRVILDLRKIITQQNNTIQKIAADLTEVKANQQHLKSQNAELQEEAEVAVSEPPRGPNTGPRPRKRELNCVRISTRRTPADEEDGNNVFGRYLPTDMANAKIRSALLSADPTKDIQVAGIGTTKTGYVIRFRDTQSAEKAQNNTEWLHELGNDTKLVKPRFGVVVHRTPTEDFDLEGNKQHGIDKVIEENDLGSKGFQIKDIAWLKKKDHPLRTSASLGIWLNTPEAAEYLITNGLLVSQRAGMEALINDHQTQNLDVLLIQEPPVTAYRTHVNHSAWRLYQPTYANESARFRSLLYINRRISTSSHRQILCNHPDVTAVKIWTPKVQYLLFSIYIQPSSIRQHSTGTDKVTKLIISGDFNRHHPAWSHRPVHHTFAEHAEELINFFQIHELQWCLPQGTPTFWSLSNPGKASTLDLTLTNNPTKLIKCHLYHDHYGSDHRGTFSEWNLQPERNIDSKPKRAYDKANWTRIGQKILEVMGPLPRIHSNSDLDTATKKLVQSTAAVINQEVPTQKPSPYSKRWFTPELKTQQIEVNRARRRWQDSCATLGIAHLITAALFQDMRQKRREWTRTVEKAKATHWKQFLDEAKEGQLIPSLKVGAGEISDNKDKAKAFCEAFFPKKAEPEEEDIAPAPVEIPWEPITKEEIHRSLKAAKGTTAPGEDEIPTLVWKHLWKYLQSAITHIFRKSVELGYYPKRWKQARIVVLRKPGKPDYTVPGAYRPISLLNTLGKILEAVMARRLLFWAETYKLLPETQFGGRPGRNTEQALLVLANAVDRAWSRSKVVTLVAFDLKGAFNRVNKTSLDTRLQAKCIPTTARVWIHSFMEERHASINFNDYQTDITLLENAGLTQGSPLSPILFRFFNSNLVDQPVDNSGGASAFIDDYFRWRVGASAEENLKTIQEEDIPQIKAWARRTGSSFAAEKTELIHLTRSKKEQVTGQIIMNRKVIKPSASAKLLGVIFDKELQ
ncbi:hypothetical protein LV165_008823 [Aspergillus fumigatus]|nr:hypothetical protein LV165_008823 [Aspergillus fumigatus]